jgi:RNA polymerase sigma-54 factor
VPDVVVEYNDQTDQYDVRLARGNTRELRISTEFREALEKSRDDKAAREFIKQKIEAANAIIDAVRYRRERLLEVAKSVVEAQRDFLDYGEQHLKVLRMSDLAARFGCDPSTISRTVDEKYMQTPRGIFPLRRFFTGGTESGSGEVLGWDSIKAKVQEIVDNEDKSRPLSDDEIVVRLSALGIEIKRRTVAKYRAQLNIPTARRRRQY